MNTRFFDPPTPRLFGHRGSGRFPENTLPAFRDAVAAGLICLELDAGATFTPDQGITTKRFLSWSHW